MALGTLSLNASAPSAMSADLRPLRLGQLTFISFVSSPKPDKGNGCHVRLRSEQVNRIHWNIKTHRPPLKGDKRHGLSPCLSADSGLNKLEFMLDCRTITTISCMTPSNVGPIFKNGSKGLTCGLNPPHTLELISDCRAVAAFVCRAPGNDGPLFQNRSKCITCGLNLLLLSWSRTAELSPPPRRTTEPSARIAAKALFAAWICCTPLSWSWSAELLTPYFAPPQVKIALSPGHHKAKANFVAATCGWSTKTVRHSPSSISASSNVFSGSARTRFLAVTSLRFFRLVGPLSLILEQWKKAEVTKAQCAHSATLH